MELVTSALTQITTFREFSSSLKVIGCHTDIRFIVLLFENSFRQMESKPGPLGLVSSAV
jgi:hypothetical protein